MFRNLLIIILIIFIGTTVGCNAKKDDINNKIEKTEVQVPITKSNEVSDFSILYSNSSLSIGGNEDLGEIKSKFGEPISSTIEVIGSGADTYTGSFIKNIKYDGMEIRLMSPKGDGKRFWILDMTVTNQKYQTKRGAKIGESIENLLIQYPDIKIIKDGRRDKNNCGYIFSDKVKSEYISFEVKNGVIIEMKIYKELL